MSEYMGRAFPFFLLSLRLFLHCACSALTFPTGRRVTVGFPSPFQPGFIGRAYVLTAGNSNAPPGLRAALSVEAVQGRYSCSMVVLLGGLKVWSSDHSARFTPAGSCILDLTVDGDLQIKDSTGRVGWRSGTPGVGVQSLRLKKRTGNLILTDATNRTRWQSFDHPTQTLLCRQQLNSSGKLTSYPVNSSASYSFEVEQDKVAAYLHWKGNTYSYWELKPRPGRTIAFVKQASNGLKVFDKRSKKVAQILAMNSEAVRFLSLGSKGNVGLYYYSASRGEFEASYKALRFCDLPLPCGPYGVCSPTETCSFLQISGLEYHANFCESATADVEMAELEGIVTVLRSPSPTVNVSKEECLFSCLEDCSCAAALYLNGNGNGVVGAGDSCHHYSLVGGAREVEIGADQSSYWIKIAKKASGRRDPSSGLTMKVLVGGGIVDGVALCAIIAGLLYYFIKVRKSPIESRTNH